MRRLYPLCDRLARSELTIIIEGETGTGKEVLAESIHRLSARSSGPFVVFDCTAVPASLVEAELFGYERGAFTGAQGTRRGLFEQASGGTLLIDEIGDLPLALQPKLLRAVERREIRRLGGDRHFRVDTRVLAATRRDLDREVQEGRFRDDLFHRLAMGRVEIPPLRSRTGDVRALVKHFCCELGVDAGHVPVAVLARWEEARWPGNVRELRNAVTCWFALGDLTLLEGSEMAGTPVAVESASSHGSIIDEILSRGLPLANARQTLLDHFDRLYLDRRMMEQGNHVGRAAAASGIGRRYFQMLMARRKAG
jgi:transcriptional regulator with GAF, ATPase, and Fis domain